MDATQHLEKVAAEMHGLLEKFKKSAALGLYMPIEDQANFKRMGLEAKSLIDEVLGIANDFSMNLVFNINRGGAGMAGGPSYATVSEAVQLILGATKMMKRKQIAIDRPSLNIDPKPSYVDPERIIALQKLVGKAFDYSRLAQMCGELNMASDSGAYLSVAMLVRAITDHVPPVFGQSHFSGVVANFPGKSNKQIVRSLEDGLRPVADKWLHTHIRRKESLPTNVQVDFRTALDALLEEIIRIA